MDHECQADQVPRKAQEIRQKMRSYCDNSSEYYYKTGTMLHDYFKQNVKIMSLSISQITL